MMSDRYEINPVASFGDCAPKQGFSVVQGDERIRTAVRPQRTDLAPFNPGLTERGETPPRVLSWHGRTATAATMQSPRSVSLRRQRGGALSFVHWLAVAGFLAVAAPWLLLVAVVALTVLVGVRGRPPSLPSTSPVSAPSPNSGYPQPGNPKHDAVTKPAPFSPRRDEGQPRKETEQSAAT